MVKGIAMAYRSTVYQLVDGLTEEQMDAVICKAREIIALVECENE